MEEFAVLEGAELATLLAELRHIVEYGADGSVYRIRIALDGGVKIKVNEGCWSPPMGHVVPTM